MTLTFLTDHTAPRLRALDEWTVQRWHEQGTGPAVTLATGGHDELKDSLEQHLVGPRPPDVMTWFASNRTQSLTDRGLMLDLSAVWDRADLAAYEPRFRALPGADWYLPTTQYWWAVFYRPSLFARLGIDAPVRTWAALRTAAGRLQAAGIAPFALGAAEQCPAGAWFDYLNLRLNGPGVHDALLSLREPYAGPRVSAVLALWRALIDEGWFLGQPASYDEAEAVDAVLRGTAGMTLSGSYICDEYVPPDDLDLDFFRFPVMDPALPVGEDAPADGYFATGRGAAPDDAAAFLAFLGSREVQQRTVETLTVLPTRTDVAAARAARHVAAGLDLLRGADRVFQFYDLDTPWELAQAGLAALVAFLRAPGRAGDLLQEVDALRAELR